MKPARPRRRLTDADRQAIRETWARWAAEMPPGVVFQRGRTKTGLARKYGVKLPTILAVLGAQKAPDAALGIREKVAGAGPSKRSGAVPLDVARARMHACAEAILADLAHGGGYSRRIFTITSATRAMGIKRGPRARGFSPIEVATAVAHLVFAGAVEPVEAAGQLAFRRAAAPYACPSEVPLGALRVAHRRFLISRGWTRVVPARVRSESERGFFVSAERWEHPLIPISQPIDQAVSIQAALDEAQLLALAAPEQDMAAAVAEIEAGGRRWEAARLKIPRQR